jgi:hypothetical protein
VLRGLPGEAGRRALPEIGYDRVGAVWFGGADEIAYLENGRIVQMPLPAQARGSEVQAPMRDGSGAMWVSVVRKGIFRFLDGEWSEYGNLDALPRGPSIVATEDGEGSLWFGYPDNRLARVNGGQVQVFDTTHGVEVGNILSILARGTEVWVGEDLRTRAPRIPSSSRWSRQ